MGTTDTSNTTRTLQKKAENLRYFRLYNPTKQLEGPGGTTSASTLTAMNSFVGAVQLPGVPAAGGGQTVVDGTFSYIIIEDPGGFIIRVTLSSSFDTTINFISNISLSYSTSYSLLVFNSDGSINTNDSIPVVPPDIVLAVTGNTTFDIVFPGSNPFPSAVQTAIITAFDARTFSGTITWPP